MKCEEYMFRHSFVKNLEHTCGPQCEMWYEIVRYGLEGRSAPLNMSIAALVGWQTGCPVD